MSKSAGNFLVQGRVHFNEEDMDVWETLLAELQQSLSVFSDCIHPSYQAGFAQLSLSTHRIPDIVSINQQLSKINWVASFVEGFVPAKHYVRLLSNHILPISTHIRKSEFIRHSPSPDFIHDVLGHLPMLFCEEYREFIEQWARVAAEIAPRPLDELLFLKNDALIKAKESDTATLSDIERAERELFKVHEQLHITPTPLSKLTKLYVWGNEYGLLRKDDKIAIFGSAIMSSTAEINAIACGKVELTPFDMQSIQNDVDYTSVQRTLYPAESFQDYLTVLNSIPIVENEKGIARSRSSQNANVI